MVRKIGKKHKEIKDNKQIDKEINIGLEFIKNYCGEELYWQYYDLSMDTSTILVAIMRKINEAYRLSKMNNNKQRVLRLSNFIKHANGLIQEYNKHYHPSSPMIVFSCLFLLNKYFSKYTSKNYLKKRFKTYDKKVLMCKDRYNNFSNIFRVKNIEYDIAFNKEWQDKLKMFSQLIADCCVISLGYSERVYNNKHLKNFINDFVDKCEFKISGIETIKETQEYELIINIEKLLTVVKTAIESEYFFEYMKSIRIDNVNVAEKEYEELLTRFNQAYDIFGSFISLAINGK